jgi:hypothetical protein
MSNELDALPISKELFDYHFTRFQENGIPIAGVEADERGKARRVVVVDPLHLFPANCERVFKDQGYEIVIADQRVIGEGYIDERSVPGLWCINIWPRGFVLAEGETRPLERMKEHAFLPWACTMAEDIVAVAHLFDAAVVVGVGRAGGMMASEVSKRLRIPMLFLINEIGGVLGRDEIEKDERGVVDDLAVLWAESSAFRSANAVAALRADYTPAQRRVLQGYDPHKAALMKYAVTPEWIVEALDALIHASSPWVAVWGPIFAARDGHAFHRATQLWRGDMPLFYRGHRKVALALEPHVKRWIAEAETSGRRLVVALGGIQSAFVPGDAFFRRTPSENFKERVLLDNMGGDHLRDYLMSDDEIDYGRLDAILEQLSDPARDIVYIPSDTRRIDVAVNDSGLCVRRSRRYESVPIYLTNALVVFLDLTTSPLLRNVDVHVFYEPVKEHKFKRIRTRNAERDPSFDYSYTERILKIEREKIAPLREKAHALVDSTYAVRIVSEPRIVAR